MANVLFFLLNKEFFHLEYEVIIISDLWNEIRVEGIASVEKLVGEFNIYFTNKSPYKKIKIKVYENEEKHFESISDLKLYDGFDDFYGTVGSGKTVDEAIESAVDYFFEMLSRKDIAEWKEEDYSYADEFDF